MPLKLPNRTEQTWTGTGTGAIVPTGSVTDRRTFAAALSDGDTTIIVIENPGTDEWEICASVYTAAGDSLSRGTLIDSSTGSRVAFSAGPKNVFVDAHGETFLRLDQTTAQTITGGRPTFAEGLKLGLSTTVGTFAEGKVYYDDVWQVPVAECGRDLTLQIGQEEWQRCFNNTGSQIDNGKVVYVSGAYNAGANDVALIDLADASSATKWRVLGVTTQDIPTGEYGMVCVRGNVNGLNTNAWSAGDELYLSDVTPGAMMNTTPAAGNYKVRMGRVITKSASVGRVDVRIFAAARLGDLSDTLVPTPTVGNVLIWNGTNWVDGAPAASSASIGIAFFMDDTAIIGTGANNANEVVSLSKTPVTTTSEVVDAISVTAATSPVLKEAYLYNTALGRTQLDGGVWTFNTYASVSSTSGGRVSSIKRSVYAVEAGAGTLTTTGTGTTRRATATTGTPFVSADNGATRDVAGYVQTPQGLYEITNFVSGTEVDIETPSGYANESGVAYSKWKYLFQAQTPTITALTTNYTLYTTETAQPAYAIATTTKLGEIVFGVSNNTTTVNFTHNGTARYSHFVTPLITLHNNLAGLDGGGSGVYNHLTAAQLAALHAAITLGASVTDVLSLSTQAVSAVDAGADKLVFWDDSEGKLSYATLGTGLSFTATTLNISAVLKAGQLLCRWVAQSGVSPATNGATFDARNGHPVLDFDDATDESTIFTGVMPASYAGGGVKVEIHYGMTSATSGKVAWDVAFERVSDSQQDIDSDGFAAANRVNVAAVPGTSGHIDIAEVTFTDGADMASVAAGEGFRLKITRVPSDTTNDTASGDAELWAVEVREAG